MLPSSFSTHEYKSLRLLILNAGEVSSTSSSNHFIDDKWIRDSKEEHILQK